MIKRLMSLTLMVVMMLTATCAAEENYSWNLDVVRVAKNGMVRIFRDDGTYMKFLVEYRQPFDEPSAPNFFWIGYVPDSEEDEKVTVFTRLLPEDHNLIISDDGEYRLLVSERALKEAYDLWVLFGTLEE